MPAIHHRRHLRRRAASCGFTLIALLALMAVMAIGLLVAEQTWDSIIRRENEAELIFRGEQYAMAIHEFKLRGGGYPTDLEQLVKGKPRYLRQAYLDPMTPKEGEEETIFGLSAPKSTGIGLGAKVETNWYLIRQDDPMLAEILATLEGKGKAMEEEKDKGPVNVLFEDSTIGRTPGKGKPAGGGLPTGPILGVVSTSDKEGFRSYNERTFYNEWYFMADDVCGVRSFRLATFMLGIQMSVPALPCPPKGIPGMQPGAMPPGAVAPGGQPVLAPQPPRPRPGSGFGRK